MSFIRCLSNSEGFYVGDTDIIVNNKKKNVIYWSWNPEYTPTIFRKGKPYSYAVAHCTWSELKQLAKWYLNKYDIDKPVKFGSLKLENVFVSPEGKIIRRYDPSKAMRAMFDNKPYPKAKCMMLLSFKNTAVLIWHVTLVYICRNVAEYVKSSKPKRKTSRKKK